MSIAGPDSSLCQVQSPKYRQRRGLPLSSDVRSAKSGAE